MAILNFLGIFRETFMQNHIKIYFFLQIFFSKGNRHAGPNINTSDNQRRKNLVEKRFAPNTTVNFYFGVNKIFDNYATKNIFHDLEQNFVKKSSIKIEILYFLTRKYQNLKI